jgi:hypothetical protein
MAIHDKSGGYAVINSQVTDFWMAYRFVTYITKGKAWGNRRTILPDLKMKIKDLMKAGNRRRCFYTS